MGAGDDDLLARLNALKPSPVSLAEASPSIDVQISKPQTVEDRLAARLKGLRSSPSLASPVEPEPSNSSGVARQASDKESPPSSSDPLRNPHLAFDADDQSVEDLLAELGPSEGWQLGLEDRTTIDSLMKEAKEALARDESQSSAPESKDVEVQTQPATHADVSTADEAMANSDQEDDAAADDYVARLLAEIDIDKKYGAFEADEEHEPEQSTGAAGEHSLAFPSTPSALPQSQPAHTDGPPSYEDSELETRFSNLGLSLPSTPTSRPGSSKPKGSSRMQPKTAPTRYTDEDIESWCCICNEDGEVRCLGCDNDIYCNDCWEEGHGNGPGQERGHRAVQYVRKGPVMAA